MSRRVVRVRRPELLDEIDRTKSTVIEASAGTGKTYALEHIVADAVLAGTPVEEILVITFTDKAAAELELRVRRIVSRLERAWHDGPGAEPEPGPVWALTTDSARRLEEAQLALGRASISTIHGFCHGVLRDLAFRCGAPFERELQPDERVFDAAFAEVVRREVVRDPALSAWLSRWTQSRSLDGLADRARELWARRAAPEPCFDAHALAGALDQIGALPARPLTAAIRRARVAPATRAALISRLTELQRLAARFGETRDLAEALEASSPPRWDYLLERLDPSWPDAEAWRHAVAQLVQHLVPEEAAVLQVVLPPLEAAAERIRSERGWMTFSDMVDDLDQALAGPDGDELVASLRSRWRLALIDEFQDTDPTQWRILDRVFGRSPAHRLVLVGDPKQAIYGFRGADVQTYMEASETEIRRGARRVRLARSYRSTPALVDATNRILEPGSESSSFFSGVIHLAAPIEAGRPEMSGLQSDQGELPPVHLLTWPAGEPLEPRGATRRTLARGIAAHLSELEARGLRVEGGPLLGGDLFVLTRTSREADLVVAALRRQGRSAVRLERRSWARGRETADLRAVFAAIERPDEVGRALAAFETPFFGVPTPELGRCRDLPPGHPLAERLLRCAELAETRRWPELFAWLVDGEGTSARAAADPELRSRWPIYEAVLDATLRHAEATRATPGELVRWLTEQLDGEGDAAPEPDVVDPHPGAIRVSTIHGAKGLEAEVVVVFGGLYAREDRLTPYRHEEGWRVFVGPEPPEVAVRQHREEEERLLYVAITRARRHLILPFFDGAPGLDGPYAQLDRALARCRGTSGFSESPLPDRPRGRPRAVSGRREPGRSSDAPMPEPDPVVSARLWDRRGDEVTSYTDLKHRASADLELEPNLDERAPVDRAETGPDGSLPGGPRVGQCLHALLETVDRAQISGAEREGPPFRSLVESDPEWLRRPLARFDLAEELGPPLVELVVRTMTRPLPLGARPVRLVDCDPFAREVEFTFSIPLEGRDVFVRGFIDALFVADGEAWVLDYKSDLLPSYDPAAIAAHVGRYYGLQAELYGFAARRWLAEATPELPLAGVAFHFARAPLGEVGEGLYRAPVESLALDHLPGELARRLERRD